jgi:voltage-gated potassium channel
MLVRLIVYFAYFLKSSPYYRNTKLFFYNLLENPDSRLKSYFDVVMICLVLLSVFLLIYEVDTELTRIELLFEQILVALFIIEYLLRAWLYNDVHKIILEHYEKARYLNSPFRMGKVVRLILAKKIEYIFTPLALIDLLAILPSYRTLRVLRGLLIFRLFKLSRYFNSLSVFLKSWPVSALSFIPWLFFWVFWCLSAALEFIYLNTPLTVDKSVTCSMLFTGR